jgi:hypothetical protein
VDLYLGPDRVHFHIHQKLLCKISPVFDKMFNSGFAEATKKSAELPEDDSETFESFILWLYRGTLDDIDKSTANSEGGPMWERIKLYCFAEKYCIDVLADSAMDTIIDGFTGVCIHADSIYLAYQNTSGGAALRSYMATGFAFEISVLYEEKSEEELERLANISDFARDVFCILAGRRTAALTNPDTLPKCEFHRHGEDKPCTQHAGYQRNDQVQYFAG